MRLAYLKVIIDIARNSKTEVILAGEAENNTGQKENLCKLKKEMVGLLKTGISCVYKLINSLRFQTTEVS